MKIAPAAPRRATLAHIALAGAALLALAGCSSATAGLKPTASPTKDPVTGTVTVFAASSLTDVFASVATAFEKQHPGVKVVYSFGGSDALAAQINSGAPADVFAAASDATMAIASNANTVYSSSLFATNTLEIAVPPSNPAGITGLKDFTNPALKIALCAPTVPCGAAATKVFAAAGLTPAPDTLEPDVKSVLTKVEADEVDAGLVYTTDVLAAGSKVKGIVFPESTKVITDYPIAEVKTAPNPTAAASFVAFVVSPDGQAILKKAGFAPAP